MAYDVILIVHIFVGVLGVVLGPVAIFRLGRNRTGWVTAGYHLAVALVCVSAAGLVVLDFAALWWFLLVAAGSYAFAARAVLAIRSARPGWQARAVRGFGGAFIALWTAILVVSVPGQPLIWAIPTVLGIVGVEWYAARVGRRIRAAGMGTV